jgi:surface polysaccharide O-acyltransferase-like enzyme
MRDQKVYVVSYGQTVVDCFTNQKKVYNDLTSVFGTIYFYNDTAQSPFYDVVGSYILFLRLMADRTTRQFGSISESGEFNPIFVSRFNLH